MLKPSANHLKANRFGGSINIEEPHRADISKTCQTGQQELWVFMVIRSIREFNRSLVCFALIFGPRLVLGSGQVIGWGNASNVPASASNSIAISAGYYLHGSHIALKEDGTIVSWNNSGLVATVAGLSNVMEVASGYSGGGIALKTDGNVVGWGNGNLAALMTLSNIVCVEKDDLGSTCLRADGSAARIGFNGVTDLPGLTNIVSLFPFHWHPISG